MPAVRTRPVARPAVRLRAVPPLDPPFDDELAGPAWPIGLAGQLALPLPVPGGASPADQGRPDPATPVAGGPPLLPPGALATASAEARQAARRFLGTCLEILNGYRPAAHIRPLSVGADATAITEQLVAATRRLANGTTSQVSARRPAARRPRGRAGGHAARCRRAGRCDYGCCGSASRTTAWPRPPSYSGRTGGAGRWRFGWNAGGAPGSAPWPGCSDAAPLATPGLLSPVVERPEPEPEPGPVPATCRWSEPDPDQLPLTPTAETRRRRGRSGATVRGTVAALVLAAGATRAGGVAGRSLATDRLPRCGRAPRGGGRGRRRRLAAHAESRSLRLLALQDHAAGHPPHRRSSARSTATPAAAAAGPGPWPGSPPAPGRAPPPGPHRGPPPAGSPVRPGPPG